MSVTILNVGVTILNGDVWKLKLFQFTFNKIKTTQIMTPNNSKYYVTKQKRIFQLVNIKNKILHKN